MVSCWWRWFSFVWSSYYSENLTEYISSGMRKVVTVVTGWCGKSAGKVVNVTTGLAAYCNGSGAGRTQWWNLSASTWDKRWVKCTGGFGFNSSVWCWITKITDIPAPCKYINQDSFGWTGFAWGTFGAYMGHKKASDKQWNWVQVFFEKYNCMKKLRKHQKIHRMAKNIYELWISSYIRSAQR